MKIIPKKFPSVATKILNHNLNPLKIKIPSKISGLNGINVAERKLEINKPK